jgi:hypothetical protein
MTLNEMIILLMQHLSDEQAIGWPVDHELIAYLDRAVDYLSDQLIALKDPTMRKSIEVLGVTPLPEDFVSFIGNVPVNIVGRSCEPYADIPETLFYWGKFPSVSKFSGIEETPYTREQALMIVGIAQMFALNRNEYDISQDMALLGTISKAMATARSG